jgi:hypothetical protein
MYIVREKNCAFQRLRLILQFKEKMFERMLIIKRFFFSFSIDSMLSDRQIVREIFVCFKYQHKQQFSFSFSFLYSIKTCYIMPYDTVSKLKEKSHSATLAIMQQIKFINQLIYVICGFSQCSQIHDQTDIVRLRVEFLLEHRALYNGQSMT